MDPFELIFYLIVLSLFALTFVLPIVALVLAITTRRRLNKEIARLQSTIQPRTSEQASPANPGLTAAFTAINQLAARIDQIEAALRVTSEVREPVVPAEQPPPLPPTPSPPTPPSPQIDAPPPAPIEQVVTRTPKQAADIESIIGRRLVGWIAIGLILLATAFFLKFAFDNRWIGELGRVAIGVTAGVGLNILGYRYHRRGWRIFSQLLTAGGIVLLYLSVYAAFGYYHLVTQKAAFVYLVILVAQAAGLAVLYNAQSIAVMALIGGFLAPVLLRSDRDQYPSFFGYLALLDVGALAMPRHWLGLNTLAFGGTHLLFWMWHWQNYHPRKLTAVMTFHTGLFLIFLLSALGRRFFRREAATIEDLVLLPANAFVFFATAYFFLNPEYHDWMGLLAIGMAIIYAGTSKLLLDRKATSEREMLTMIGVALTFVTVAIPIQLKANWITIAWAMQAVITLWVAIRISSTRLLITSYTLLLLAVGKLFVWDTYFDRAIFTPMLNKYFLSSLVVTACVFLAASLHRGWKTESRSVPRFIDVIVLMVAIVTLWWLLSVETITYFFAHASALKEYEDYRHQLWLGQMALSVLWTLYAAVLAAIGFVRRSAAIRWAALVLFGVTVVKVMFIDIAQLRQLYRIVAFLVLGVVLLVVAWGYHKAFRRKESLS